MKKFYTVTILALTTLHLYPVTAPPAPGTKADLTAQIKKVQSNIDLFKSQINAFKDTPEAVTDLNQELADAQAELAYLQNQIKTAPTK